MHFSPGKIRRSNHDLLLSHDASAFVGMSGGPVVYLSDSSLIGIRKVTCFLFIGIRHRIISFESS